MKRIMIFIGLKIIEIVGAVGVYYLLCLLFTIIEPMTFPENEATAFWLGGVLLVAIVASVLVWVSILVFGVYTIIKANWRLSKKLSKEFKQ